MYFFIIDGVAIFQPEILLILQNNLFQWNMYLWKPKHNYDLKFSNIEI